MQDIGTVAGVHGNGCLNKKLTLKAYDVGGVALALLGPGSLGEIFVTIPDTVSAALISDNFIPKTDVVTVVVPATLTGAFGEGSPTVGFTTQDTGKGYITLGNLKIPGTVTRITLESGEKP